MKGYIHKNTLEEFEQLKKILKQRHVLSIYDVTNAYIRKHTNLSLDDIMKKDWTRIYQKIGKHLKKMEERGLVTHVAEISGGGYERKMYRLVGENNDKQK